MVDSHCAIGYDSLRLMRVGTVVRHEGQATMTECPEDLLDEIVRRLVNALHPMQVYLFGSHATGTPDQDSDIDLLVVVPDNVPASRDLARAGRKSLWGLRVPVDLIVCTASELHKWSQAHCNVIHTAVEKGRLLYAS